MALKDSYAQAVNADSLDPKGEEVDTLAAYALADRTLTAGVDSAGRTTRPSPLAVPLARLLEGGDESVARHLLTTLAAQTFRESFRMNIRISPDECLELARAALEWMRQPRCDRCGGQKMELVPGTPYLSVDPCQECGGSGERPFPAAVRTRLHPLVAWMRTELERSLGRAQAQAAKYLQEPKESSDGR